MLLSQMKSRKDSRRESCRSLHSHAELAVLMLSKETRLNAPRVIERHSGRPPNLVQGSSFSEASEEIARHDKASASLL